MLRTMIRVLEVMVFSRRERSRVHSEAEVLVISPFAGGERGTYFTTPPGISMLEMYLIVVEMRLVGGENRRFGLTGRKTAQRQ